MADPASQLASIVKASKSGQLRGIAAKAAAVLTDGQAIFDDLTTTLDQYSAAVDDARAIAAYVRQELSEKGSNQPPVATLKNPESPTVQVVNSVAKLDPEIVPRRVEVTALGPMVRS